MSSRLAARPLAVLLLGLVLSLLTAAAAVAVTVPAAAAPLRGMAPARDVAPAGASTPAAALSVVCTTATDRHHALASRMSLDIAAALQGRSSIVGLKVADSRTGVTCKVHQGWHFHAASIAKVIILGALLRHLMAKHRDLSPDQVTLTTEMITESSNSAATTLWDEVGRRHLQRFLNLAKMTHTHLGPGTYWGLTRVTAHDELLLLKQLKSRKSVLDKPSRSYALSLMASVIPSQRWGVTAGAPTKLTAHLKNGWLPDPVLWVINSIGLFTGHQRSYRIAVLTRGNPTMTYGVDTVQAVAEVINHELNPDATHITPPSAPQPSWGTPDERIP
jgi:hypothetical protein